MHPLDRRYAERAARRDLRDHPFHTMNELAFYAYPPLPVPSRFIARCVVAVFAPLHQGRLRDALTSIENFETFYLVLDRAKRTNARRHRRLTRLINRII